MYPSASDAEDVVMWLDVAVIARGIVQESYLAGLSHSAKLLQDPMDRGGRHVGMLATYCHAYFVGARMVFRSQQGLYHCKPLGCYRNSSFTTAVDKLAESLHRVFFVPPPIHQPYFSHRRPLADSRY
jgi:hypothetical protein